VSGIGAVADLQSMHETDDSLQLKTHDSPKHVGTSAM
jgi:hypothetical protein